MSRFDVGYGDGTTHGAVAGLHALDIYEQEFGRDLIKDVYGVVEVHESDISDVHRDGDDVVLRVDYTSVEWTSLVRAVWACIRNADESTPSYAEWEKQADGMNMRAVQNAAMPAFEDAFFREGGARAPEGEDG